jgi:23S rRNA (adenine2503-C2)-methyltransferase
VHSLFPLIRRVRIVNLTYSGSMHPKDSIFQFPPETLTNLLCEEFGQKTYVAKQVLDWVYDKGVYEFEKMSNLSKSIRTTLASRFDCSLPEITQELRSPRGETLKLRLKLRDGREVESVFMKERKKATICLSSQVGCVQGCSFCATGKMGIIRNLSAAEMIAQVLVFKRRLASSFPESVRLVFMGMGEPFHNLNQLFRALDTLTHSQGLGIGARKITVSTSGVVKGIFRLMEKKPQVQLAISLHTVDQSLRNLWIPNQKETVGQILGAAKEFTEKTGRKITFELVLFGGDHLKTAQINRLGKALKDIRCNINAIPYNPIEGAPQDFVRPTFEEIEKFRKILSHWNQEVTVRISKGRDIQAACGQLIVTRAA